MGFKARLYRLRKQSLQREQDLARLRQKSQEIFVESILIKSARYRLSQRKIQKLRRDLHHARLNIVRKKYSLRIRLMAITELRRAIPHHQKQEAALLAKLSKQQAIINRLRQKAHQKLT